MKRTADRESQPIIGTTFEFWYPACNRVGIPLEWVPERLLVHEIVFVDRVSVDDFRANPFLRRGPTLIRGIDLHSKQHREIILEAVAPRKLPMLQLVLIDLDDSEDTPEPVSRKFAQTFDECERIIEIADYLEIPEGYAIIIQTV